MLSRARASLLAGSQVVTKANGIVFLVCAAARNGKHKVRHRHIRLQTLNKWIQRFASTRKRLQGAGKLLTDSHKSLAMQLSNNCACVTFESPALELRHRGQTNDPPLPHYLVRGQPGMRSLESRTIVDQAVIFSAAITIAHCLKRQETPRNSGSSCTYPCRMGRHRYCG